VASFASEAGPDEAARGEGDEDGGSTAGGSGAMGGRWDAGAASVATAGPYGAEGFVYQAYRPIQPFDGFYPIIGSWVIAGEPAGIGIREDKQAITGNTSRFVPHYFE